MKREIATDSSIQIDPSWKVGIVASFYYKEQMDRLVEGAQQVFREVGLPDENVTVYAAPGSFEVPLIGAELAHSGKVDGLIGLGIILEGETHHARLLAESTTRGIADIQVQYRLPFAFEILYVNDLAQVEPRTRDPHNKGKEAAYAVLQSLSVLRAIRAAS